MLTKESLTSEYANYVNNCNKIGIEIESIFDSEKLINAPASISEESGNAFPGGLVMHCNLTLGIALKLSKMISRTFDIDNTSLAKVCLLNQIGKVEMFEPETEDWKKKRGDNYKFSNTEGVLKVGERSALIALNNGVKLTPTEFEAFRVIDRDSDEYNKQKYSLNILSIIVKQANELAYAIEKERNSANK